MNHQQRKWRDRVRLEYRKQSGVARFNASEFIAWLKANPDFRPRGENIYSLFFDEAGNQVANLAT